MQGREYVLPAWAWLRPVPFHPFGQASLFCGDAIVPCLQPAQVAFAAQLPCTIRSQLVACDKHVGKPTSIRRRWFQAGQFNPGIFYLISFSIGIRGDSLVALAKGVQR